MKPYFSTFTVTVASPAVFTCVDHGLYPGDTVVLETTGALPTGLSADTEYYVVRQGITTSTFRLSISDSEDYDGTAIVTTGTQSGTHSFLKLNHDRVSPNIEDCR